MARRATERTGENKVPMDDGEVAEVANLQQAGEGDPTCQFHLVWPALKVIVVSGRVAQAVAAEVADAFVPKPYDPARILHAIGRLLSGAPE